MSSSHPTSSHHHHPNTNTDTHLNNTSSISCSRSDLLPSTIPSDHVAFHLAPATQTTVVTTTTTTTLNFPPVILPRPASPPVIPESALHSYPVYFPRTISDSQFNSKHYPLIQASMPSDWIGRGLPLTFENGSFARFDPGQPSASSATSSKSKSHNQSSASFDPSRKRTSISRTSQLSVVTPSPSSVFPPRKKVRLDHLQQSSPTTLAQPSASPTIIGPTKSQSTTHSISGLLSPLPSGFDQKPRTSANDEPDAPLENPDHPVLSHPLHATDAQLGLATVSSLPTLIHDFSNLPPHLQQYTLFNLLRTSSIPVLQFVQNLVAPALKRDFVKDLPPEIAALILSKLDGRSLCRASKVSKTWNTLIDHNPTIWRHRLVAEGLWVGDGGEAIEADECRLLEQGVSRLDAPHFTRLWNAGTWLSPQHIRRTRKEDGGSLRSRPMSLGGIESGLNYSLACTSSPSELMHIDDLVPASPASQPRQRVPIALSCQDPQNRFTSQPSPLSSPLASPQDGFRLRLPQLNKYKLLYRKRHLIRHQWKTKEPRRINFAGHGLTVVTCLQFDWSKLVAASDDSVIHSYELRTGQPLMTFTGHQGGVWALQYLANTLVTGSTDRTVRVWDMATGRNTHVFAGHTSTVRCLQIVEPVNINPDPDAVPVWEPAFPLIVTGSRDHTLRVWKLPSEDDDEYLPGPLPGSPSADETDSGLVTHANPFHMFFLRGHSHAVRALAAAGRTVVSGSYDCTVRVWDLVTGECRHEMRGHTQKVYSVVIDRLRDRCASGSMDSTVRLWDLTTGTTLRVLDDHVSLVGLLGFSHTKLVSAAADSTLRIWDPETGAAQAELKGHAGAITCFRHDEARVVSGSDGTLKLWDAQDGSFVRDLCAGYNAVWQVGFDERFAVVAVQRGQESEYEVLDFGRTDGRTDEEDAQRCEDLVLGQ